MKLAPFLLVSAFLFGTPPGHLGSEQPDEVRAIRIASADYHGAPALAMPRVLAWPGGLGIPRVIAWADTTGASGIAWGTTASVSAAANAYVTYNGTNLILNVPSTKGFAFSVNNVTALSLGTPAGNIITNISNGQIPITITGASSQAGDWIRLTPSAAAKFGALGLGGASNGVYLSGSDPNGATAIAVTLNSTVALTTLGARILDVTNNGAEGAWITGSAAGSTMVSTSGFGIAASNGAAAKFRVIATGEIDADVGIINRPAGGDLGIGPTAANSVLALYAGSAGGARTNYANLNLNGITLANGAGTFGSAPSTDLTLTASTGQTGRLQVNGVDQATWTTAGLVEKASVQPIGEAINFATGRTVAAGTINGSTYTAQRGATINTCTWTVDPTAGLVGGTCSYIVRDTTSSTDLCTVSVACTAAAGANASCTGGTIVQGHVLQLRVTAPAGDTSGSGFMHCSTTW